MFETVFLGNIDEFFLLCIPIIVDEVQILQLYSKLPLLLTVRLNIILIRLINI